MFRAQNKGFTLIELLVVISIIALLSSIVMSSLNTARTKAKTTVARQQMASMVKAFSIAQGEAGKTLIGITLNTWTLGNSGCTGAGVQTVGCYNGTLTSFTRIQNATNGLVPNLAQFVRDPWGNPYLLDENQGEGSALNCSNLDELSSAGPDSIAGNGDDIPAPINEPLSPWCP